MAEITPRLDSARSAKARFARIVTDKALVVAMWTLAIAIVVCGLSMVAFVHSAWGWFIASLSAPLFILLLWVEGELRHLPIDTRASTIDGWIDSALLGQLHKDMTPNELAIIAMKDYGGMFFAARFGLGTESLPSLVSRQASDTPKVWQVAEQLRQLLGAHQIDAAILTVALFQSVEQVEPFLARAHLDMKDLVQGAHWYLHMMDLIAEQKQRARDAGGIGRDWSFGYTPILGRFGINLSDHVSYNGLLRRELEGHEQILQQMIAVIAGAARRNVALVGPFGSGKTTIVRAFAKKLLNGDQHVPANMRFHQVIELDASQLLAQARGRGELEQLIQHVCVEALSAKNIVLFFDEAQLFFEEKPGSVDLSNILLPILEGGALRVIFAMDEQHWQRISLRNTALTQYLNRVSVPSASKEDTMLVLQDQLLLIEYRQKVLYTYQSLEAAYDLSSRYMNDQAMPGKALKLLEAASHVSDKGIVTRRSVEAAIEQTQGVKVANADSESERATLLHMEELIHQRMINQTRAVTVVSDALRRARAGVRNTQRPIGTFLFLGPTGVGKTELAKSLGAVYFGGEDRLVRIDLNEYVRAEDVSRLISDAGSDPNSLTAQIGRQPFSVVLLDEIEKAHDAVLSTLLQMLDEGIMRDINNREVSFRDAIVIATSNAGADKIRLRVEAGEQLEQFEDQFTDELVRDNIFRPELINRFDEIVLFRPLNQAELLQVIDIILNGLNKNLASQKVTVTVEEDAKKLLVSAGYDPRMGARPMRRIVQRVVENIVAKRMLSGQVMAGDKITLTTDDVQSVLKSDVPQQ